ncbi:hypothetical protein C1Y40_04666 [Mycobacterium talmoniae]|uniref:Uncharacterized protein n=1 Tax=Mycobacterium talmoniae TaxID=1858794 RepID=A0A1S1N9S3_9MYCO|nr:hypothetical protein BKN37_20825 [Mycobacterium talmoniae]PQM45179.1 hypothetical protein C1Y40_04666 [Mycobacterium talmoniae]
MAASIVARSSSAARILAIALAGPGGESGAYDSRTRAMSPIAPVTPSDSLRTSVTLALGNPRE